jgi:hypothetical protein
VHLLDPTDLASVRVFATDWDGPIDLLLPTFTARA